MIELSVVVPVKDEENNIEPLLIRLIEVIKNITKQYEILFVTDINKDNSVELLSILNQKYPFVKAIKLSNSYGQSRAVFAGLEYCKGKHIVIMDGDFQDLPEDISILYEKIQEGYDVVYTEKKKKNDKILANIFSKIFNWLLSLISDVEMEVNSSLFRIISSKMKNEVLKFKEYDISLSYLMAYINLPTSKVLVQSGKRERGQTKYNLYRRLNLAITSLLSFSTKPLRMITTIGFFISLSSFCYFIIIMIQKIFFGIPVLGWSTLIALITFLGGFQILIIGVIGEYLGKTFMQTKNRPLYIIEEKIGDFE